MGNLEENKRSIKGSKEYGEFLKELDKSPAPEVSAEEIGRFKEEIDKEIEFDKFREELDKIPAKKVERRLGKKSDYYRRFYSRVYELSGRNREAELDKIEKELDDQQIFLDAEEKKLAAEAMGSRKISKELKSRILNYNRTADEIKIKRTAYNALVKNFQDLKFTADERDVVEKPWKVHGVTEADFLPEEPVEESEIPPELTPAEEQRLEKEAEIKERARRLRSPEKTVEIAPDYEAEIKKMEAADAEAIKKLEAQIKSVKKSPHLAGIVQGFKPKEFVAKSNRLFDLEEELVSQGFVPGHPIKNFFNKPFDKNYRKSVKEFNVLNKDVAAQTDIVENYLELADSVSPVEEREMFASRERPMEEELAFYKKEINALESKIREAIRRDKENAERIDFSAKDYFIDFISVTKLQDKLINNFGFFIGQGGGRNLWEAIKRGNVNVYRKFKKDHDGFLSDLNQKDRILKLCLGAEALEKTRRAIKHFPQPELIDRLEMALKRTNLDKEKAA
ncbi:MAG: hypothetical protein PHD51_02245 [Patescibacteria group bacterium]|nr:hypothetical protein [Patescibacteria group bacterium]MDD5490318.1 hypothetical protein [Patescibacteria group bacterium]